jgi:uncharacterized membrane protein
VGSCVLAFPIAVTEEVWTISESLSSSLVLYLSLNSLLFIALFTYHRYFSGSLRGKLGNFLRRVFGVYIVMMIVSAQILFALNRLTTVETVAIALKRVVLVSFPASFAGTVVDSLSRE